MFLAPEGDEAEIADAAAGFLADAMPIARLHAPGGADMDTALRRRLGEMGWFGLALPEERGGSGLTSVEHVLFFREVGRQCGAVDVLAQALAANLSADGERRKAIATGANGVALLVEDGETWRLIGAADAELALLVNRDGASLYAQSDLGCKDRPALDPANSLHTVTDLPGSLENEAGERLWQLGQLGAAAMLVGLGETALELIVDYAKVRETFGRPIGAYQAVRHACADMAIRLEAARAQLWYAAAAFKEGRGDASVHIDAAKHLANEAGMTSADGNIQLHGGIGVTDEHDAHLLLKHAMLLIRLFGSRRGLLARLLHARLED